MAAHRLQVELNWLEKNKFNGGLDFGFKSIQIKSGNNGIYLAQVSNPTISSQDALDSALLNVDIEQVVHKRRNVLEAESTLENVQPVVPAVANIQPIAVNVQPAFDIQSIAAANNQPIAVKNSEKSRMEQLDAKIKRTRMALRKVREQCDDALFEGDVVSEGLERERKQLEGKLAALSKLFKKAKASNSTHTALVGTHSIAENGTASSNTLGLNSLPDRTMASGRSDFTRTWETSVMEDGQVLPNNSAGFSTPRSLPTKGFERLPGSTDARMHSDSNGGDVDGTRSGMVDGYSGGLPPRTKTTMYEDASVVDVMDTSDRKMCDCGKKTNVLVVQFGENKGREYHRCMDCGFHSFVHDQESNYNAIMPVASVNRSDTSSQNVVKVLHDVFGHTSFRPKQDEVVAQALQGKDVFVLMPTGGGKSLCYQLPACINPGITIVISPLVSLIQDQVQQLNALDIAAANLSGEQDYETVQKPLISKLFQGDTIKLLYVTPEKIGASNVIMNLFTSLQRRGLLSRFVIDEAHCISTWGHDFRPDYMALGKLRTSFSNVPIMALTATANGRTEMDIIKNLNLQSPFVTRSSFNRSNLVYDIRPKKKNLAADLAAFVQSRINESGIIYCLSRNDCENICTAIRKHVEPRQHKSWINFYHAGLEPDDRADRHRAWSMGKIKVIVATLAFGMGINKPDVRYVIHHTIPQSVTHYYQESGRAGRDGLRADCIMYYTYRDASRRKNLLMKDKSHEARRHLNVHIENLRRMIEFCENEVECRRTLLLEYFGEKFDRHLCNGTCDNCMAMMNGARCEKKDVSSNCVDLLQLVRDAKPEEITIVQTANAYLGTGGGKGRAIEKSSRFGSGKGKFTKNEAERLLHHMIFKQYINEVEKPNGMGFTNTFILPGVKASSVSTNMKFMIDFRTKRRKAAPLIAKPITKNNHKTTTESEIARVPLSQPATPKFIKSRIPESFVGPLIQQIQDWRASVCDNFDVLPYHMLPDTTINSISRDIPTSIEELRQIEGVGKSRIAKYGTAILKIVSNYLLRKNLVPTPRPLRTCKQSNNAGAPSPKSSPSTSRYFKNNDDDFVDLIEKRKQPPGHSPGWIKKTKTLR